MIAQLLLFFVCIAGGGLLRGVYFLMRLMQRHTGIIAVTVITDFIYGVLFFAPLFLLALFYNDGLITVYMAAGQLLGFFLTKLLF